MTARLDIRPPRSRDEAVAYSWVFFHSLVPVPQPTLEQVEAWTDRTGPARMRLAMAGGEVLGGLVLLDMGQYYGGRSVPMTGVSAVAIAPEHRSRGVGRALLATALAELKSRRVALSALYPATQPIYRRLGYEIAGVRQQWRLRTATLATGRQSPAVRPLLTEDLPALRECYATWASRRAGLIHRIDWGWKRVLESPDIAVRAYVVDAARGAGLEGYVVLTREPKEGALGQLKVRDLVALTPRALERLLALLADHRSVAPSTLLWLGPSEAAWLAPDEQERHLESDWRWMLRVVDAERAVAERGFPSGLRAELAVEIEDAALRGNAGRFVLSCADGRGSLVKASTARRVRTKLDVRGLAALYSGHASAHELALAGLASGHPDELGVLTAMFAGPAPWTPDMW